MSTVLEALAESFGGCAARCDGRSRRRATDRAKFRRSRAIQFRACAHSGDALRRAHLASTRAPSSARWRGTRTPRRVADPRCRSPIWPTTSRRPRRLVRSTWRRLRHPGRRSCGGRASRTRRPPVSTRWRSSRWSSQARVPRARRRAASTSTRGGRVRSARWRSGRSRRRSWSTRFDTFSRTRPNDTVRLFSSWRPLRFGCWIFLPLSGSQPKHWRLRNSSAAPCSRPTPWRCWLDCRQAQGDLAARSRWIARHGLAPASSDDCRSASFTLTLYLAGRATEAVAICPRTQKSPAAPMTRSRHVFAQPLRSEPRWRGRYAEAARVFDDARQFGRKHGVLPLAGARHRMSCGFHLSAFDYEGAEALQLEARELAEASTLRRPS